MPEHIFTVVARGHATDVQTNTLTLFSVVEELVAPGPVALPEVTVATLWRRGAREEGMSFVQRTRLVDPEGEEIFHGDSSFRMDRPRHRNLVTVQMTPFPTTGCYHFEILCRKEDEENWPKPVAFFPVDVAIGTGGTEGELFHEQSADR